MIKLIALDMDGTLLDEQKELKQAQIDAIHQAVEAGVKIVLCTGRPLAGVKPFVEQLGFDTEEEFIIVNNGCSTHSTKDWSLIDWEELSSQDIAYLDSFTASDQVQISLFDEEDYFVLAEKANARVNLDAGLVGMTPISIDLAEATAGKHRFFEAMFVGEKEAIDAFENQHNDTLSKDYTTVRSQDYLLEILPNGASKASGLKKLADRLGILPEEIMAMGDANNDLEMIEFAGLGIAMGNANEQVKAIAQDITDTNENNGVAKAIEKHILNK
ncbi:Cof-type HAD-IIB family hydrolase [Streptococcus suis]|uniref:Cof-type HAD-IIB family hydrolase n=1 Tax=Streptococcus suis TaxID=1307 RepID=A0AAW5LKI2_STRSU|nr:Cof-type HAD-IIB family hydrolase [Streptococcus suis]AXI67297.1 Cof-type HAD-IIB family hydrolase [Streptococcus suis]MCR1232572.1 Cof-type HAD-IIB family hydrolase [Streptococcus suis]HEM3471474.1 HAD family phosphatase [Streptococcus suis]HEM3475692.1 HAD family phosphatase [Streptococcus suis]HEM3482154.1 HAD family phosphatase [Streptococcus suis]